jgi:hypothetical protein
MENGNILKNIPHVKMVKENGAWNASKLMKESYNIFIVSMTSLLYEQGQLHHLNLIRQDQHFRQAVTRILTPIFHFLLEENELEFE